MSCSTIKDFEGDVVMALNRCCNGGSSDPPPEFQHDACPVNTLLGSRSKLEYSSASASVCSYLTPPQGTSEYRNEYYDWGTGMNGQPTSLTPAQKQQLCSALNAIKPPDEEEAYNTNVVNVNFYNPQVAYIGPVVTRFSLSKGGEVRANYELEEDNRKCTEALAKRKELVAEYMKLETYNQICTRFPDLPLTSPTSTFCTGLGAEIDAKRAEIKALDVPATCSKFDNPDLKNLMHSLLEFTTSNSEILNRVGFNTCTSLPSIFYRRFVDSRGIVQSNKVCGNSEIMGPGGNVNTKMNISTAVANAKGCTDTRRFLTSLDIVFNSAAMNVVGQADRMKQDPSFTVVSACSNFSLGPSAMVQLNNLGKTNVPTSTFTPGIFATEFEAIKNGTYLNSKSGRTQDGILKRNGFLDSFITESMTYQDQCELLKGNLKVLCALESTDIEPRPLPFFSNNPYLQLFSIREQLGVVEDNYVEDVVDMNPVGATETSECETSYLGVCQ